jgi:hypothetical protein
MRIGVGAGSGMLVAQRVIPDRHGPAPSSRAQAFEFTEQRVHNLRQDNHLPVSTSHAIIPRLKRFYDNGWSLKQ